MVMWNVLAEGLAWERQRTFKSLSSRLLGKMLITICTVFLSFLRDQRTMGDVVDMAGKSKNSIHENNPV